MTASIVPDTEDPQLVSLLLMGEAAQVEGDFLLAQRCYQRALELRPEQPGATLNLGVTLVKRRRFHDALETLTELDRRLAEEGSDPRLVDVRLAALYNIALVHWHRALSGETPDRRQLRLALTTGRRLALDCAFMPSTAGVAKERRPALERLRGGALTLLAGMIVDALGAGVDVGGMRARIPTRPPAPATLKGRIVLARQPWPPPWLAALEGSDWCDRRTVPVLAAKARRDYAADARTRYNLAVLEARVLALALRSKAVGLAHVHADRPWGDTIDRAFEDLEFAFSREPSRVAWARKDLLLLPLKDLDARRFTELVRPERGAAWRGGGRGRDERMEDRGSPIAYNAVDSGTPVLSSDGHQLGVVQRVLADEAADIFDGIVISTPSGDRFVDSPDVGELFERAVTLKLSAEQARTLPEPEPAPAVVDLAPDVPVEMDRDDVGGAGPVDKVRDAARRLQWRLTGRYQPKGRD